VSDYLVVTSPENWLKTAGLGWTVLGLKSTKRNVARSLRRGDRVLCYETGLKRFIGVVEIAGDCYEDHTAIWTAKKDGEDFPYRYPIRPVVTVDPSDALDAVAIAPALDFPKKWGEHLSLAFQGNIKPIPADDVDRVASALREADSAAVLAR
jgi:predicted RNA-binding protein